MKKGNRVIKIAVMIALALFVLFFFLQLNNTKSLNQAKIEKSERFQEKWQKELEGDADAYMKQQVEAFQTAVREAGIADFDVTWEKCSQETYETYVDINETYDCRFFYYYLVEYHSDQIALLQKEKSSIDFCDLMEKCLKLKNKYMSGDQYGGSMVKLDGMNAMVFCTEVFSQVNWEYCQQKPKPKPNVTTKPSASDFGVDPYDVQDYPDADSFADEWAEEFGDGDYEDGYDEACDYWENGY